jgi:hypothetical protein
VSGCQVGWQGGEYVPLPFSYHFPFLLLGIFCMVDGAPGRVVHSRRFGGYSDFIPMIGWGKGLGCVAEGNGTRCYAL